MERSDKKKIDDYVYVLQCYNRTFSPEHGQVVLEHIMKMTGAFDSTWPNGDGPNALRNLGIQILSYAGMEQGQLIPDIIKGIIIQSSEVKPEEVRQMVEEYLREGGEIN